MRDDFGPDSDVDVLIEFDPEHIPGLAFFGMEAELSQILGRQVDLNRRSGSVPTSVSACRPRPSSNMSLHDPIVALRHMLDYAREVAALCKVAHVPTWITIGS